MADPETRNQLLWNNTDMTLDQMVQKAQQFKDFHGSEAAKPQKVPQDKRHEFLDHTSEKQIEELQKQIAMLPSC